MSNDETREMREKENKLRRCDEADLSSAVTRRQAKSPFDIPGIQSAATMQDILDAVRESRAR